MNDQRPTATRPTQINYFGIAAVAAAALTVAGSVANAAAPVPALWGFALMQLVLVVMVWKYRIQIARPVWSAAVLFGLVVIALGIGVVKADGYSHPLATGPERMFDWLSLALNAIALFFVWTKPATQWLRSAQG